MAEFKQSPIEIVEEGKPIVGIPYILYRPHRAGLAESMAEMKIFHSSEEFIDHIVKNHWFKINPKQIIIDYKSYIDERIGWIDSHYVIIDHEGYVNNSYKIPERTVIGMVDLAHWYKEE